jgi:hypothetical protein
VPDESISFSGKKKGRVMEDLVSKVLDLICKFLCEAGLYAHYHYYKYQEGKGRISVDHVLFISNGVIATIFYIEDRNRSDGRITGDDDELGKLLRKFAFKDLGVDKVFRIVRHGLVVGHQRFADKASERLKTDMISYADIGEVKARTKENYTRAKEHLIIVLMSRISIYFDLSHMRAEGQIEILNSTTIRIRFASFDRIINLRNLSEGEQCLDDKNLLNFYCFNITKRGVMQLVSPLKIYCRDKMVRVRRSKASSALYHYRWPVK